MDTVIIHGPAACGKTRNSKHLQSKFGCSGIIDGLGDDPALTITPGHLHLTNLPESMLDDLVRRAGWRISHLKVLSFSQAMKD
jgi:hypothetical protein